MWVFLKFRFPLEMILFLQTYLSEPLNHVNIWQASPQPKLLEICQIRMWYSIGKESFYFSQKINERGISWPRNIQPEQRGHWPGNTEELINGLHTAISRMSATRLIFSTCAFIL